MNEAPEEVPVISSTSHVVETKIKKGDGLKLKQLFDASFPLKYSDNFYNSLEVGEYSNCRVLTYSVSQDDDLLGAACVSLQKGEYSLAQVLNFDEVPLNPKETLYSAYVLTLATTSAHQRKGMGKALIEALVMDLSRDPFCVTVYLHVLADNKPAISLYEKCGFVRLGRIPGFYDIENEKKDAFVYVKYLSGALPKDFSEVSDVVLKGWFVSRGSNRNLADDEDGDDVSPNEDLLDAVADALTSTWATITGMFSDLWKTVRADTLEPDEEEFDPNEQENVF